MKVLSARWIRAKSVVVLTFFLVALLAWPTGAMASLENDHYDGNIFALYAGNGSLVPPRLTLAEALNDHRVTLLVYYLDDSAVSKRFAGVVSELQRVWGNSIELMPLVTDPLQGREDRGPTDPLHYWRGVVPQVVVLGQEGQMMLDAPGQVEIDTIHAALSRATGLPLPPSSSERRMTSFNELNDGWQSVAPDSSPRD
ncbi:MAG: thylakoid membrane photosystem I accumulation factor [Cyanobium sp.]|jgi:hypothetical protein